MLNWLKIKGEDQKVMKWMTFASIIYVLPLMICNVYFNDDVARSIRGYYAWENNGRPLATVIMKFVTGGHSISIVDGSPFYLILGLVILAYTCTLFARKHLSTFSWISKSMVMMFVVICPFLLENLSFKYDVLFMLLSLSIAYFLYAFDEQFSRIGRLIISSLFICVIFCFYQGSICAYIILAVFECIEGLLHNDQVKTVITRVIERIASLGIGAILYELIITYIVHLDAYSRDHSGLVSLNVQGLQHYMNNIIGYKHLIESIIPYFKVTLIILLIACIVSIISVMYKKIWAEQKVTIIRKFVNTLGILLCVLLMIPVGLLPVTALKYPVFCPRTLIGLTAVSMMIGMALAYLAKKKRVIHILTVCILIFAFTFSASYANTLKAQKDYEEEIAQNVAYDLSKISVKQPFNRLAVGGKKPKSRQFIMMDKQCHFIARTIFIYLNSPWIGQYYIMHFYNGNVKKAVISPSDEDYIKTHTCQVKNENYKIYIHHKKVMIIFKK